MDEAKAGADIAGSDDLLEKIASVNLILQNNMHFIYDGKNW